MYLIITNESFKPLGGGRNEVHVTPLLAGALISSANGNVDGGVFFLCDPSQAEELAKARTERCSSAPVIWDGIGIKWTLDGHEMGHWVAEMC